MSGPRNLAHDLTELTLYSINKHNILMNASLNMNILLLSSAGMNIYNRISLMDMRLIYVQCQSARTEMEQNRMYNTEVRLGCGA